MDQRKPAAPAPAPEMSHGGRAGVEAQHDAREHAPSPAAALDQLISRELQAIYQEVVNEPIPERLLQLLENLERKQGRES